MTDLSSILQESVQVSSTDKQVGYLLRAVEDLTKHVKGHIAREERERESLRREMKAEVESVRKDLKTYLKYTAAVIVVVGGAIGKLDPSVFTSLFATFSKILL
jgi:phage host-nuclease inhibitor protein Gam